MHASNGESVRSDADAPAHGEPITRLFAAAADGDSDARERVWRLVYDELRKLASNSDRAAYPGNSARTTTLIHQTYIRLVGNPGDREWASRKHFFATAAKVMRTLRIDQARAAGRLKRGSGRRPISLDDSSTVADVHSDDGPSAEQLLALDEALSNLERMDARKAEIVMLQYFVGMTQTEVAETLGLSVRTVADEWRIARAWLHRELNVE